jgi:folate-dependent phosphoribosylglycinamide formyltransferase PurN
MRVVALCQRLRKAAELERHVAGEDVELLLLVCRSPAHGRLAFAAALTLDVVRGGPAEWRLVPRLLGRRRARATLRRLHDPAVLGWLRSRRPDVGLHATNVIYRGPLLDCFRLGVLNPHIGLLPRYRGRSVMEWSLLCGDPTGVTTFFVDEGIDTGRRIVLREEVPVDGHADVASAKAFLSSLDGPMYARALDVLRSPDFTPMAQEPEDGTRWYAMSALLTGVVDGILSAS